MHPVITDEDFAEGAAVDLIDERKPLGVDHFAAPEEIEVLTLFVNRRSDLSEMPSLPQLRALKISGTPAKLPNVSFPLLEFYDGPLFEGASKSEALRWWHCTEGRSGISDGDEFVGPLEVLQVNGNRCQGGFPRLAHPECLREISVWRFSSFDVAGMADCAYLEKVYLASTGALLSANEIGALASLDVISLDNVRTIEPLEAVYDWAAREVIAIAGKHPFSPELRRDLEERDTRWLIPPSPSFYVANDVQ